MAADRPGRCILVTMSSYRAAPRRHLATSPFSAPDPEPPAERFSVDDKVTHDKHGLGTVTGVEDGTAVLIDFGPRVLRILTPCAKLTKL
jgi:hypothetical protein